MQARTQTNSFQFHPVIMLISELVEDRENTENCLLINSGCLFDLFVDTWCLCRRLVNCKEMA